MGLNDPLSALASERLKPPVQERSRRTLEKILEAGMALLDEKGFQGVSMADIASRAGISVATLYTRFQDKETLVDHLFATLQSSRLEAARVHFRSDAWQGWSVGQRVDHLIERLVEGAASHRGLLRALSQRQLLGEKTPSETDCEHELASMLADWLRNGAAGQAVSLPEPAARMAVSLVTAAVRARIVLGITRGLSQQEFVTELTKAVHAYIEAACAAPHDSEGGAKRET